MNNLKPYGFTLIRGDTYTITFFLYDNGQKIKLGENGQIFFTAKKNILDTNYVIQKTLSNGITFNESTLEYTITIESTDTDNLEPDLIYPYDIKTVISVGERKIKKTIQLDSFYLKANATQAVNEVASSG